MATLRLFRTFIDQEEDIADAAARRARSDRGLEECLA